jgi:transposase InsO family protein
VKYAWIKQHQYQFKVQKTCKLLQVSRSSYYEWVKHAAPKASASADRRLSEKIKMIFIEHKCRYGARRICQVLLTMGHQVSKRRIARLMKAENLCCKTKRKFKFTTDSNHRLPISPNLLKREFTTNNPNQVYVGDITYIWTQEGRLYLAIIIDLFSRQVVGWAMEKHMQTELVNKALLMAIWKRKPGKGLIWHTDRGSQYASQSHRDLIKMYGIKQSMSRKGDCWDNAVAESFFHSLKVELTHHEQFKTREEAKQAIFEYIEIYYNRIRLHSANNYLSPVAYEIAQMTA